MSREDFVYMCMLFGAIPFGHVVKVAGSPDRKQFLTFIAGLFVAISTTGLYGIAHSFFTILGTYIIVKIVGPRYGSWSAFVYVFGYLFFFRTCHWYGLPKPPPYANAIQLIVTLRMCTIAFEGFQLSCKIRPLKLDDIKATSTLQASLYDTMAYGYCYCGLMTGPYFRFSTYVDMLKQKNPEQIPTFSVAINRIKYIPFLAAVYIPLNNYFPVSHLVSSEYLNHEWGFVYHIAYLMPMFLWFRWRFYIGWLLAESSCISLGLGAYPEECKCQPGCGPTVEITQQEVKIVDQKYNFETIHNIKVWETEFAPTFRKTTKTWNMTVQWWLVEYFYKKFPLKQLRAWATFLFSAFWHGVRPGYYLTFMSAPLVILAQARMEKVIQPSAKWRSAYDWMNWFILHRSFEYLSVAFVLLDIEAILTTWLQVYFYSHIVTIVFIIIPSFLPRKISAKYEATSKMQLEIDKKHS